MSPTRASRARRLVFDALGFAAAAATLVLAWPGLQVARADEALMTVDPVLVAARERAAEKVVPVAPRDAGPSCGDPGLPSTLNDAMVAHQARRMIQALVDEAGERPPPGTPWIARTDEGIVLNGRGYNYHPSRGDRPVRTP